MKKALIRFYILINVVIDYFQYFLFLIYIKRSKSEYIVCDIDNTISDTWIQIYNSESIHKSKPINNVIKYLYNNYNGKLIFLSSRPIHNYYDTKIWLNDHINKNYKLILTSSPKAKIKFLKRIENSIIVYLDDLSYNDENGDVKFYDDVIKSVKKMNFKYIGYNELNDIKDI